MTNKGDNMRRDPVTVKLDTIGDRYGWSDDSWPDMLDDMIVAVMDDTNCDEDTAIGTVDFYIDIRNSR